MSVFEIVGLVVIGVGFLGLIAYVARHARRWDDE
jgi:Tfp pilus assembly protein PilV